MRFDKHKGCLGNSLQMFDIAASLQFMGIDCVMTSLFPERHAYLHLNALSAGSRGYKQGPVGWQGRGKGGSILSKKTPEDPKQQPLRCRSNN